MLLWCLQLDPRRGHMRERSSFIWWCGYPLMWSPPGGQIYNCCSLEGPDEAHRSPSQKVTWDLALQSLQSISSPKSWLVFLYHSRWLSRMEPEVALCCLSCVWPTINIVRDSTSCLSSRLPGEKSNPNPWWLLNFRGHISGSFSAPTEAVPLGLRQGRGGGMESITQSYHYQPSFYTGLFLHSWLG